MVHGRRETLLFLGTTMVPSRSHAELWFPIQAVLYRRRAGHDWGVCPDPGLHTIREASELGRVPGDQSTGVLLRPLPAEPQPPDPGLLPAVALQPGGPWQHQPWPEASTMALLVRGLTQSRARVAL